MFRRKAQFIPRADPMRIVFLSPVGVIGGAERVLLDYLRSLQAADPTIELAIIAGAEGPLLVRASEIGVRTILLPFPAALAGVGDSAGIGTQSRPSRWRLIPAAFAAWRYAHRLRRAIAENRPDLVHSNGIKMHLLARLAVRRGTPIIWHVHDFFSERPLMRRLLHRATRGVRGAVAISEAVARDVQSVLPGVPVAVIPNAVDGDRFCPGPAADLDALAQMPPAPTGTVRIGLVATYACWKGQEVLLRASAIFSQIYPDIPVRFFIVGGPIYQTSGSQFSEAELRMMAKSLGIDSQVGFVAFQDDPARIYNALDVVVHASTRPEPFGLTIAEAMACGCAIVVSTAGGAIELFTPGRDAIGTMPGDAGQLAAALRSLATDSELRQRLGAAALVTAQTRFRRDRLGPQLLAAYRQFLLVPA
jgi:glycosyltransferase involved in cell wall biosynthesis